MLIDKEWYNENSEEFKTAFNDLLSKLNLQNLRPEYMYHSGNWAFDNDKLFNYRQQKGQISETMVYFSPFWEDIPYCSLNIEDAWGNFYDLIEFKTEWPSLNHFLREIGRNLKILDSVIGQWDPEQQPIEHLIQEFHSRLKFQDSNSEFQELGFFESRILDFDSYNKTFLSSKA